MVAVGGAKVRLADHEGVEVVDGDIVFFHDGRGAFVSSQDLGVGFRIEGLDVTVNRDGGGSGPDEGDVRGVFFEQEYVFFEVIGVVVVGQVAAVKPVVEMDGGVGVFTEHVDGFLEVGGIVHGLGVGQAVDVEGSFQFPGYLRAVSDGDGVTDEQDAEQGLVVGVAPPDVGPFVCFTLKQVGHGWFHGSDLPEAAME